MPCPHRCSIFCILPPHILSHIARAGRAKQRQAALQTLAIDQTFRALRAARLVGPEGVRAALAAAPGVKRRTISSAGHQEVLPGEPVRREGEPASGDPAVDEAYDGLGHTWDLFNEVFGRDSIDDEGMALHATVHYGQAYDNAFWNGQQMVFGDGDGELFNRFTIAVDIIAHELGHGVTEDEGGLVYLFQPGALNEHLSDVWGALVKQKVLGQTAQEADWLIGAGLFTDAVRGRALRSMKAPGTAYDDPLLGKDPQPDHMKRYVRTYQDNGGVHINSGIPNRAFYLAATSLGGYAWEKAGRIWYETLRDPRLRANTGFRRFASLTIDRAGFLYGANSVEQKAVREAWRQVGIGIGPGAAAPEA
ncbi:MAG: M4 family metallopeptidase [Geminicoccaceae bacterium]|nr:M4 family metallopeptidase [Geminicoccaceae bacterium]MDW8369495.1 M4 family metallopeptidase [Geminicoccaceae bacterium]